MKSMHRQLSALVSMLLVLCLLTGCSGFSLLNTDNTGKNTQTSGEGPKQMETTENEPSTFIYTGSYPVAEELTTITWLATNGGSQDYNWEKQKTLHALCEMANIQLDITIPEVNAYGDVIRPLLNAGMDLPDCFQMPDKDLDQVYINSGNLLELSDLYLKCGINVEDVFVKYPSLRGQMTTPDGMIYFFPSVLNGKSGQICLMISRPYLDIVGREIPTSIDAFYDCLTLFRDNDTNENGDPADEQPLFLRSGERIKKVAALWGVDLVSGYTEDRNFPGLINYSYTEDGYFDFLAYMNQCYENELLNKDFNTAGIEEQTALFAFNGIGACTQYASLAVQKTWDWNPNWDPDAEPMLMVPLLPLTGGCDEPVYMGREAWGGSFAINAYADPEVARAAFCFMDFMISKEAILMRNYGSSCNYEYNEDEELLYVIRDPILPEGDEVVYFGNGNFKAIPDNEDLYTVYNGLEYSEYLVESAHVTVLPTIVSTFHMPEETEVLQAYEDTLTSYVNKMFESFIRGQTPLTEWDNYLAECEALQCAQVVQIYQQIFDRLEYQG